MIEAMAPTVRPLRSELTGIIGPRTREHRPRATPGRGTLDCSAAHASSHRAVTGFVRPEGEACSGGTRGARRWAAKLASVAPDRAHTVKHRGRGACRRIGRERASVPVDA